MNVSPNLLNHLKQAAGWLLLFAGLGLGLAPLAAERIQGFPIYTVYHYEDLGAELTGGYLHEDEHGQIILTSEGHIERFDGRNWTNLSLHHENHGDEIQRLTGKGDQFYCGLVGGWGRIHVTEMGVYQIEPLMTREEISAVAAVGFKKIRRFGEEVVFWGERGLVHHSPAFGNRVWNSLDDPLTVFSIGGKLYVSSNSQGMHCIEGTELRKLEGTERFSGQLAIVDSATFAGETLLASRHGGLFRMQAERLEQIETPVDALLQQGVSKLTLLEDDYVAVVLSGAGLLILDSELEVVLWIDANKDSNFASINDLIFTSEGILWATTPLGVIKLMFPSTLSIMDHRNGLDILWPKGAFYGDQLLVYSAKQVFLAEKDAATPIPMFHRLEVDGMYFFEDAAIVEDGLLLSAEQRLLHYVMDTGVVHPVMSGEIISKTIVSKTHPDFAIAASLHRFFLLQRIDGRWHYTGKSHPSIGFVAVILETSCGALWVEQGLGKASRITIDPERADFKVQAFDQPPELGLRWVNVFEVDGSVYLKTHGQIAIYDPDLGRLRRVPIPDFLQFSIAGLISRPVQDEKGDLWLPSERGLFVARRDASGKWILDFERFELVRGNHPVVVPTGDGGAFIQSQDRLIYHNPELRSPERGSGNPVLSMVRPIGGSKPVYSVYRDAAVPEALTLPYSQNSLVFEFFDNSFYYRTTPQFQTQLEGLTPGWSETTADNRVAYNQIREGRYTFRVRSVNAFGFVGEPTEIRFTILPPWYRTWWAYGIALATLAAVLALVIRNLLLTSERERKRLSTLVGQRTSELVRLNRELLEAVERAEKASEAKSQFLANMSHEIRTPLNGIIGMADALRTAPLGKDEREMVEIINQSGGFLIAIINDILDYSKIEAEGVELVLAPTRVDLLLEEVMGVFSGLLRGKPLEMVHGFDPSQPCAFEVDALRLKQVLMNLVSNAIKFTREGWIGVDLDVSPHERDGWHWVTFTVEDSGVGIPESQRESLFQPFHQLDTADNRNFGGTGLGLVICRRLTELMQGSIMIESKPGPGSRFLVRLPLRAAATQPPRPALAGRRIAVVGDHAERIALLGKSLRGAGASVSECTTVEQVNAIGPRLDCICMLSRDFPELWDAKQTGESGIRRIWITNNLGDAQRAEGVVFPQPFRYESLFHSLGDGDSSPVVDEVRMSAESTELETSSPLRVLLVEDNQTNRRVAEILLAKLGVQVDGAANGQEALQCCEQIRYALVLMDIQMPVMDGYEAAKRLRADPDRYGTPHLIALTAGALKVDQDNARAVGMDGFLTKPIRIEELRAAMAPFLGA